MFKNAKLGKTGVTGSHDMLLKYFDSLNIYETAEATNF